MKQLILGRGRFANMQHKVVSIGRGSRRGGPEPRPMATVGGTNAGHGGYVKKDFSNEGAGMNMAGVKKKLKPLKFKM